MQYGNIIEVFGPIGGMYAGGISTSDFSADLRGARDADPNETIVQVNSPGGDVVEGLGQFDLLKSETQTRNTTAEIVGVAASIASVIPLAADVVTIDEGGMMMIHNPFCLVQGDANDIAKAQRALTAATDKIVGIYQRRTGKTEAVIRQMMQDETWFDSAAAIANGFASRASAARRHSQTSSSKGNPMQWTRSEIVATLTAQKNGRQTGEPLPKAIQDYYALPWVQKSLPANIRASAGSFRPAGGFPLPLRIHEAAHATVGLHYEQRIDYVEVCADGSGLCAFAPSPKLPIEKDIAITLAGPLSNEGNRGLRSSDASGDRRDVLDRLSTAWRKYGHDPIHDERLLDFCLPCYDLAESLIDEHRQFIVRLAAKLDETGRVDGSVVHRMWSDYRAGQPY